MNAKIRLMIALSILAVFFFARTSLAAECLSPSYTVLQGKNYLDDVSPRELTAWEYESLKQLFQWMDGDWVGEGRTMKCTGPEDRIQKETEICSVSSRAKYRSHGQFTLENHIRNQEGRTTTDQTYDFYLNERRLATSDVSVSDLEIVGISATEVTIVKKARIRGADLYTGHEWVVGLRKVTDTSMEIENVFSVNGRLTSTSILRLERQ